MIRRLRLIQRGATPADVREIAVTLPEFLIGRGHDCDLRLGDSEVSRHHCIIHQRDGEVTLLDLGSANGTYLNGQRIRSLAPLRTGDELRVGNVAYSIDLGDRSLSGGPGLNDADPLAITHRKLPPLSSEK